VARLAPLVPAWPSRFADINAARDWVRAGAWTAWFKYTYFEGVDAGKYRCFVQYNLAKEAWGAGRFEIGSGEAGGAGRIGKAAGEVRAGLFRVSTAPYGSRAVERRRVVAQGDEETGGGDGNGHEEVGREREGEAPGLLIELDDMSQAMPEETLKEEDSREVVEEDGKADPFKVR
jgi:hypothetical protein